MVAGLRTPADDEEDEDGNVRGEEDDEDDEDDDGGDEDEEDEDGNVGTEEDEEEEDEEDKDGDEEEDEDEDEEEGEVEDEEDDEGNAEEEDEGDEEDEDDEDEEDAQLSANTKIRARMSLPVGKCRGGKGNEEEDEEGEEDEEELRVGALYLSLTWADRMNPAVFGGGVISRAPTSVNGWFLGGRENGSAPRLRKSGAVIEHFASSRGVPINPPAALSNSTLSVSH